MVTAPVMRVVIVDDESLGRDVLRLRIEDIPDVEVIGEAGGGAEAIELILSTRPDLVFLDVRMPDIEGLAVLETISRQYLPMVVFVTAYDEHAVRAFELNALDYLLKPVSPRRLIAALDRARQLMAQAELAGAHERIASLLDSRELEGIRGTGIAPGPPPVPQSTSLGTPASAFVSGRRTFEGAGPMLRLVVRDGEDYLLVAVSEVEAFEAAGNYVRIVRKGERYLVRGTLIDFERRLDPAVFARIHRSTIVSVPHIERVTPEPHGDFTVRMRSGLVYRMSRHYRKAVLP